MIDAISLVEGLTKRGIRLIADGPRLIAQPADLLTEEDRAALRAGVSELLRILRLIAVVSVSSAQSRQEDERDIARERMERNFGRLEALREDADLYMRSHISRLYEDFAGAATALWDSGDWTSLEYAMTDLERTIEDLKKHRGWN